MHKKACQKFVSTEATRSLYFIYLFIDAIGSSDCTASNERMINEQVGKDVEGGGRDIISDTIPGFFRERPRKITKIIGHDSRSPG